MFIDYLRNNLPHPYYINNQTIGRYRCSIYTKKAPSFDKKHFWNSIQKRVVHIVLGTCVAIVMDYYKIDDVIRVAIIDDNVHETIKKIAKKGGYKISILPPGTPIR